MRKETRWLQAVVVSAAAVSPAAAHPAIFHAGEHAHASTPLEFERISVAAQGGTPLVELAPQTSSQTGGFRIEINAGTALNANPAAVAAFERAAAQYEALITDDAVIRIDANLADLAPNVLGSASTRIFSLGFDTLRNAVVNDAAGESDDAIVGFLPTQAQSSFATPTGFGVSGSLGATSSTLRALGFTDDALGTAADATISFSTGFNFDFDNSDGVTPGLIDFETVAAHEIGHALGIISAVDAVDVALNNNVTSNVTPQLFDLFRFEDGSGDDPLTAEDFTDSVRSLVPGSDDVFDQVLPGFGDLESELATGVFNGDGFQASHFAPNSGNVLQPALSSGVALPVGVNELRVLDLIGFDIVIPEPTTAGMLLLGAGLLMARRRQA